MGDHSVKRFVFDPRVPGRWFGLNAGSTNFGRAQRVTRGDVIALSPEMVAKVEAECGEGCLRPEGAVVLNGGKGAVSRSDFDALRMERDFWRLSAIANARSAADRKVMAIAAGAASNADADAQRAALLSVPDDLAPALDAMRAVEQGWA